MNLQEILSIKVNITDSEAIKKVPVEALHKRLEADGWSKGHDLTQESFRAKHGTSNGFLWTKTDDVGDELELIVPETNQVSSYAYHASEIIKHFAEQENKSQIAILVELLEEPQPDFEAQIREIQERIKNLPSNINATITIENGISAEEALRLLSYRTTPYTDLGKALEEREKMSEHKKRFLFNVKYLGLEYDMMGSLERWRLTQALGFLMSEASQEHIFAGWLGDWAYVIADAFKKGDTGWISPRLVAGMKALYDILGHWADYDDLIVGHGSVYVPYLEDHSNQEGAMSTHSSD